MGLSMLPTQLSPIAVDVGSSSVKVLQVTSAEHPSLHALAELEIPDPIRLDLDMRFAFLQSELPGLLRAHGFKGRRIVCSPLASQVLVQPVQVDRTDPDQQHALACAQLESQLERLPGSLVVRSSVIADSIREGRSVTELLCWAMAREDSMRYVELFKAAKCQLVALHPQVQAVVGAFDHINRRSDDGAICTMYVDLGWGGMKVAIAHGAGVVFAKQVQIGGRLLDGLIAERSVIDQFTARMRRIDEGLMEDDCQASTARERTSIPVGMAMLRAGMAKQPAVGSGNHSDSASPMVAADRRTSALPPELTRGVSPSTCRLVSGGVDCSELTESMSDELSLCVRYHSTLFGQKRIDRVIFLGGESRSTALCRTLARSLNVSAQLGDPLARYADGPNDPRLPEAGQASPAWASACGLCTASVDL
ncbi:MAG: hypothetical protein VX641_05540 [Planctomycetota bacterium]|nr:hypothetical protein [Planctomycetota bacterium]